MGLWFRLQVDLGFYSRGGFGVSVWWGKIGVSDWREILVWVIRVGLGFWFGISVWFGILVWVFRVGVVIDLGFLTGSRFWFGVSEWGLEFWFGVSKWGLGF